MRFRPRIFGVEAELAGEVDIEFINVGSLPEPKVGTAVHVRRAHLHAPTVTAGKPQSEIDLALANSAVGKLIEQADARAGVKSRGYVEKASRVCWDSPVTLEELRAGKALGPEGLMRYTAGIREARAVGLVIDTGAGRYLVDRAKVKKLLELSQRFA